jgi:hypothetical protein
MLSEPQRVKDFRALLSVTTLPVLVVRLTVSTTGFVRRVRWVMHLLHPVFQKENALAGRMGGDRVKLSNLKVVKIMPDQNVIIVSGSVPGAKNSTVILQK